MCDLPPECECEQSCSNGEKCEYCTSVFFSEIPDNVSDGNTDGDKTFMEMSREESKDEYCYHQLDNTSAYQLDNTSALSIDIPTQESISSSDSESDQMKEKEEPVIDLSTLINSPKSVDVSVSNMDSDILPVELVIKPVVQQPSCQGKFCIIM